MYLNDNYSIEKKETRYDLKFDDFTKLEVYILIHNKKYPSCVLIKYFYYFNLRVCDSLNEIIVTQRLWLCLQTIIVIE